MSDSAQAEIGFNQTGLKLFKEIQVDAQIENQGSAVQPTVDGKRH